MTVITTCTNKKKLHVCQSLMVNNYKSPSLKSLAETWVEALRETKVERIKAIDLYMGDHAYSIKQILNILNSSNIKNQLYYLSTGYGFLPANEKIKSYAATFTTNTKDSLSECIISSKVPIKDFRIWIEMLPYQLPNTNKLSLPILLIASDSYINAFRDSLETIATTIKNPEDFLVITAHPPKWLIKYGVVPLKTHKEMSIVVGGSMISLNARVALYIIKSGGFTSKAIRKKYITLTNMVKKDQIAPIPNRSKPSEKELRDFIINYQIIEKKPTKTTALRLIRDNKKWKCEQRKFYKLYDTLLEEKNGHQ